MNQITVWLFLIVVVIVLAVSLMGWTWFIFTALACYIAGFVIDTYIKGH